MLSAIILPTTSPASLHSISTLLSLNAGMNTFLYPLSSALTAIFLISFLSVNPKLNVIILLLISSEFKLILSIA